MRVIIAGSRSIVNPDLVYHAIMFSNFPITTVISGCAAGVDQIGEAYADVKGIPIERYPANWEKYGRSAGYIRNKEMASVADALIAVWDGKSRGTEHMIDIAKAAGLKIYIVTPENVDEEG